MVHVRQAVKYISVPYYAKQVEVIKFADLSTVT